MQYKRIYKCLQNAATGHATICVADEGGHSLITSVFESLDETIEYFHEIKDELATNEQLEIIEIDEFHFECRSVENFSLRNGSN
jgi:hypothetical protein